MLKLNKSALAAATLALEALTHNEEYSAYISPHVAEHVAKVALEAYYGSLKEQHSG